MGVSRVGRMRCAISHFNAGQVISEISADRLVNSSYVDVLLTNNVCLSVN